MGTTECKILQNTQNNTLAVDFNTISRNIAIIKIIAEIVDKLYTHICFYIKRGNIFQEKKITSDHIHSASKRASYATKVQTTKRLAALVGWLVSVGVSVGFACYALQLHFLHTPMVWLQIGCLQLD